MRKESILELLDEANESFKIISTYKTISRPKVKSILEHLRSSLEYIAQDININLSKPKERLYFPYGETLEDFDKSIKRNFPLLKSELPEIFKEIQNIQQFINNDDWLVMLCRLTNEAKHQNAVDVREDREHNKSISVSAGGLNLAHMSGCSSITFTNVRVNGQLIDDFEYKNNEMKITKKGQLPINFKITKERQILIGDNKLDLLPFLKKCIKNIENFTKKIYEELDNFKNI